MRRREFMKSGVGGLLTSSSLSSLLSQIKTKPDPIPRRLYRDDVRLSVIGFGGIVVVGMVQKQADQIVQYSYERGVNYFDVAPSYSDGEAELKLGKALRPFRQNVFLACKTMERDVAGAERELTQSLRQLKTDYFDLYQFHAVTTREEVEAIFSVGGAVELFVKARAQGKIRYIGFSAHSEAAALALLDQFEFHSVLFPINMVCSLNGGFGPNVIRKAKEKGVARLALKMLALSPLDESRENPYPKCWYRPVEDRDLALSALRFTLSEDITAAIPPGDDRLYLLALELVPYFQTLGSAERTALAESIQGIEPLFRV